MYEAFIDLDELILRCRDKSAKKFIHEAVSCYRTGAFRSCIVSTWNAVVFDFLHKLRELELLGDKEAAKLIEKFDNLRSRKEYKELWKFESEIPEISRTKFELISSVEELDIQRLFDDRSRCAHPSMTSLEEPFEATAELARYHLRSAVIHLLQRPPVQGRWAKNKILQDIDSDNFPPSLESAVKYFQHGPLARARSILIKDIVIALTKSLLLEERLEEARIRQFSALNAVIIMYPQETREILNDNLSNIIDRVQDEKWDTVIIYLGSITVWDSLTEPCRLKAEAYIGRISIFDTSQKTGRHFSREAILILIKASYIEFLRFSVVEKFDISFDELFRLRKTYEDNHFQEKVIDMALRGLASRAKLDQLLIMRSNTSLALDVTVQGFILDKVQTSSLDKLCTTNIPEKCDEAIRDLIKTSIKEKICDTGLEILLISRNSYVLRDDMDLKTQYLFDDSIAEKIKEEISNLSLVTVVQWIERYRSGFPFSLIESDLQEKIVSTSLKDLLRVKSSCIYLNELDCKFIELMNNCILKKADLSSFEELLDQISYWDDITRDITTPMLKDHIPELISRFSRSRSYDTSATNAGLIVEIIEHLSIDDLKTVLNSFLKNPRNYESYKCCNEFILLFQKHIKYFGSIHPVWSNFLAHLKHRGLQQTNSLKQTLNRTIALASNSNP